MVAGIVSDAECAELGRLYRQWQHSGLGPVGNDLLIAVWKFATSYVGDDLGHDVYLRVVRQLNRSQGTQLAALPNDLCAYLYRACRNARKDQERRRWQHVAFFEEHISKLPETCDFGEHETQSGRVVEQWFANFEACRKLLPASIAKALELDDCDVFTTLDFARDGSEAVKKRIQRAKCKGLLAFAAAAFVNPPTPELLSSLISHLSPSLRGGPWEKILAIAPRFHYLNPEGCRAFATTLVEKADHRLAEFVRDGKETKAFKDSYSWLRTAALLSAEVVADGYTELNSTFSRYKHDCPLTGRLLDRIYALSGKEAAATEGNKFWHDCLAVMRGTAKYPSDWEAFFGAVYVIAYYANLRLSRRLLSLLHPFNRQRIEQFLTEHADELRDSMIGEAFANVVEDMYACGPHAEVNFVRVQLGLLCLSRYSRRFGKGYAQLTPETAMKLAVIAEHAARAAIHDRKLKQMAEQIRGSLICTYDLKWREFSRRCERIRSPRHPRKMPLTSNLLLQL